MDNWQPGDALADEGRNLYYPSDWQRGDPVYTLNETEETVTWSCSDCGETLTAPAYLDLRQCGNCGDWQDVPDGSGLHFTDHP